MTTSHLRALATVSDDFLNDYFAFYPTIASNLGLHAYDGRIVDLHANAIAARIEQLQDYQRRLSQIDPADLDRLATFEYGLLHWQVELELWHWTEERDYVRNPMVYAYNIMVDTYVKRNYAPLEVRLEALTRHLRQIPAAMQVARQNLIAPVPRVLVEESLTVFAGFVTFLTSSLPDTLGSLEQPALASELWAARDAAVGALELFNTYLRDILLPSAHDQFAIGADQFQAMLHYAEQIDIPLDRLLAIGEADLVRNQIAATAVAARMNPRLSIQEHMRELGQQHPPANRLIADTQNLLEGLRRFLVEHDLVSIPSEVRCQVAETPPFARWAFAMMSTAGPFEQNSTESYYYVTLPDPDWSPTDVEGWLTKFDNATMPVVSMHEAYPGHYVHFLHMHQAPSRLAKVFTSYSHIESWAHYVEQMMLEQGYGGDDPRLHLAQLAEALTRNCRYVCAIKMHTQGMSIDEATRYFMQHAYMDEVTARQEARRGTHDPGYLNYTLGKLMLLKLRDDYRAAVGASFSLKQFHDEYIRYGAPPLLLLRRLLLPGDSGELL